MRAIRFHLDSLENLALSIYRYWNWSMWPLELRFCCQRRNFKWFGHVWVCVSWLVTCLGGDCQRLLFEMIIPFICIFLFSLPWQDTISWTWQGPGAWVSWIPLKGQFTQKLKFCHFLTLMSLQTCLSLFFSESFLKNLSFLFLGKLFPYPS